jgi:hypothetical protein
VQQRRTQDEPADRKDVRNAMLQQNKGAAHVPPPLETSEKAQKVVLDWLAGDLKRQLSGRRVLVFTYNDAGYLGLFEDADFVTRYQFSGARITPAPLNKPREHPSIREGVAALGKAITALAAKNRIVQIQAPEQYAGAAVLYALPN